MKHKMILRNIKKNIKNLAMIVKVILVFIWRLPNFDYRFTINDLVLHINERLWVIPEVKRLEELDCCLKLSVEGKELYWPNEYSTRELGWLYLEIFTPYRKNPSSYANPLMPIPEHGWVLDAGCCEGFFTMYALQKNIEKVISVEPIPKIAESLQHTFLNEISNGKVFVESVGLSDVEGIMSIGSNTSSPWDSSLNDNAAHNESLDVPVTTIDNLAKKFGLTNNGLMKMDIEGAEMSALQGMTETLKNYKPRLAIAVYHDYNNANLCKDIILKANSNYKIEFRGMYQYFYPPRPYMLFAY